MPVDVLPPRGGVVRSSGPAPVSAPVTRAETPPPAQSAVPDAPTQGLSRFAAEPRRPARHPGLALRTRGTAPEVDVGHVTRTDLPLGRPLADGDLRFERFATARLAKGVTMAALRELADTAAQLADRHGRATPQLAASLQAIDRRFGGSFSVKEAARFQGILGRLGVTTHRPIVMPENKNPIWMDGPQPLRNHGAQTPLPKKADVVILGAGLTGAAAALHLAREAEARGEHLRIVVLEAADTPAFGASGRNGGNFELYPENFLGDYEGLETERFQYLKEVYPHVDDAVLKAQAARQARTIMEFTGKNRDIFIDTLAKEKIECDFVAKGWLRLPEDEDEEKGLRKDVELATSLGRQVEMWSPEKIKQETNIDTKHYGRWSPDGHYQPYKYTTGVLQAGLAHGVELFTRAKVTKAIDSQAPDRHLITTQRGTIEAKFVISALNAFSGEVFPELAAIQPTQSQIVETTHVPVQTREDSAARVSKGDASPVQAVSEMLVTGKKGDIYAHPVTWHEDAELAAATGGRVSHRGSFVQGGGLDLPFRRAGHYRRKQYVLDIQMRDRAMLVKGLEGQPPARAWSGPMGFTPDRLAAVGFLRPGVFVAAGFNGYGGSFTQAAGRAAALSALTGEVPTWAPQDVFSPRRFLSKEPLFSTKA